MRKYKPSALPSDLRKLTDIANEIACRAILVGSSLRDADNGIPPVSHSLYVYPKPSMNPKEAVKLFQKINGPDCVETRSSALGVYHYVLETPSNGKINLRFCDKPYMLTATSLARHVPIGLSAIAMNLFSGEIVAAEAYRLDKFDQRITLAHEAHGALGIAEKIQHRYPDFPIYQDYGGELRPALRTAVLA